MEFCAVIAVVEIVRVELAAAAFTVTDATENAHVAPVGNPEHAKLTVPVNPPLGVSVNVVIADAPGATVPDAGLAAMEKAGTAALTTRLTAFELLAAKPLSPLYCAVSE